MNIPDKVKVGYKEYEVQLEEHLDDETHLLYGYCHYEEETIKLCTRYTENQQKCTLVHELVHAVDNMNDIGLTEEQVVKLGKGLYQLIKDNEKMFS